MKTFVFVVLLFLRAVSCMLRRLVLGPRRPGWGVPAEFAQVALRTGLIGARWWGVGWLRTLQSKSPNNAAVLEGVRFEAVDAFGVPCEWCRPKSGTPERTLVYLHGGGYVVGSVDSYRELIARLAVGANAEVLAANYRLAPESHFPAANDDCVTVYRWLLEQGVAPSDIALAGDSAGGALCIDVLRTARDAGEPLPAAAVLFSPWIDPLADAGSMLANEPFDSIERDFLARCIGAYMGGKDASDSRVAPTQADLSGLPPLMIAVGTCEILLDQDREFAAAAATAGVDVTLAEYEDCFHLFQNLVSFIPTAQHALADCCQFLQQRVPIRSTSGAHERSPGERSLS